MPVLLLHPGALKHHGLDLQLHCPYIDPKKYCCLCTGCHCRPAPLCLCLPGSLGHQQRACVPMPRGRGHQPLLVLNHQPVLSSAEREHQGTGPHQLDFSYSHQLLVSQFNCVSLTTWLHNTHLQKGHAYCKSDISVQVLMVSTLHLSISGWTCSLGFLLVLPSSRSVSKSSVFQMLAATGVGVICWAGVSLSNERRVTAVIERDIYLPLGWKRRDTSCQIPSLQIWAVRQ